MISVSPDSPGEITSPLTSLEAKATESDDGSASIRSTTPLPAARPPLSAYAKHGELINSSDTLRQIPSPMESSNFSSSADYWTTADEGGEETLCQEIGMEHLDSKLQDGVALRAAKVTEETMNAKRAMVASLNSPQTSWDILQGKRDEEVEEQVNILGLDIRIAQESGMAASDISRTPSQSTTGTEKSTSGSFGTAASSLQSAPSSDSNLHDKDVIQPIATTTASLSLESSQNHSPKLYITACSSTDDLLQQKRSDSDTLRRYHALLELIETEKGYVEDLSTLANIFFQNLSTQAFFDESEARLKAVRRNIGDILDIHTVLGRQLKKVVEDYQISQDSEGSDMEKALRCEEAIIQVAMQLSLSAPSFEPYQIFCSRHAEALVLIREAEKRHNGDDFAAFERMCGNQIRGSSKVIGRNKTPSRRSSAGSSTPLAANYLHLEESSSVPTSGSNTPSGSFASISRQASGRLLFADYLIKPIQRLCLYPLVLNSLLKYTPEEQIATRQALIVAMNSMRKIADDVDSASKQREKDLMTEVVLNKIEVQPGVTSSFLKSLGNPLLSGTLDVLYHHDLLAPLTAPLRFHRLGLILWHGFLLFVRVRKNQQLDCKYWIPLGSVQLTPLQEETVSPGVEIASWAPSSQNARQLVPFAMRISYFGHHFELSALNDKERSIWHHHLTRAIEEAPISHLEAFPSNLAADFSSLHHSASATILNFFVGNSKSMSNAIETLVRLPSPSARVAVDRNMIFSEKLLSQGGSTAATSNSGGGYGPVQFSQKDISDVLIAQQLRQNSTPSIGSAVGAAMGLARMAATQVPTAVKRSRRQSMFNLTEITPTCDALLSESPGELSPAPPPPLMKRSSIASFKFSSVNDGNDNSPGAVSSGNNGSGNIKWKNTLLRRNSKILGSKTPINSVPPSPMTSLTDLSQSLKVEVPTTPFGFEDARMTKPKHLRSKSLRDVWQNSIGRRSRSQSNSSEIIAFRTANLLASPSGSNSLTSSPVLENSEMEFGPMRTIDYSLKNSPDVEASTTGNRSRISSFDSTGSSSIAHLKRILSSTSAQGSLTLTRARASGSRFIASNKFGESPSSPSRARVERSNTELVFPVPSSPPKDFNSDRRNSEPDALHIERRKSIAGLSAQHPLRRLGRKKSYNGPSSPASSVLSLTNSNLSPSWADHSRLNSVKEQTNEVNENVIQPVSELDGSKKPIRPMLIRRPSTADM